MLAHSLPKFDRFESVLIKSCAIEPALTIQLLVELIYQYSKVWIDEFVCFPVSPHCNLGAYFAFYSLSLLQEVPEYVHWELILPPDFLYHVFYNEKIMVQFSAMNAHYCSTMYALNSMDRF